MKNPWNVQMKMEFDLDIKDIILKYYRIKIDNQTHGRDLTTLNDKVKQYLQEKYKEGYGFKIIARTVGISYTQCRRLFINILKIPTRKGTDVCTNKTREFRKDRVTGDKSPWYDWPNNIPELQAKNSKGIQGYFLRKNGKKVWLRSTWEYIYAKWLDTNNINWSYETKGYKLSNSERYRPDFSILDEENNIKKIVEIKGYFKNRLYKVDMFKKDYPNIEIIVIDDVTKYGDDYHKELKQWKQTKL